ncbi:KAP family P-loop domain-containing protein [Burkholderia sp. CF099]|nr:KAP family P-loop domain-containing protein [Burkholderia sp. CF099]
MTLQSTKSHLVQLLDDPDNRVVALSGKWGTGKSHLWREVRDASTDTSVKNALYVSLFGLTDMNQLKLKIVQSVIPNTERNSAVWDQVQAGYGAAKKVLKSLHSGFSALDELALLAVPSMLKNRTIVLDDIERKHDKLNIDEILGFIDEYTQLHGARIVLILNSDKLADKGIWDKMREKVIDEEVRLDTSPSEAFDIAIRLRPSPYVDLIRTTVETCRLTNIRIISKVVKTVNRLLEGRGQLADAVLRRTIPSTVLLAAIHYNGIENGPTFDFVLNSDAFDVWAKSDGEPDQSEDATDDEAAKRHGEWKLLMQKLGIFSADDYELLVVEYLESGLVDPAKVGAVITRYVNEADATRAHQMVQQLREDVFWNHRLTDAALLERARALIPSTHYFDGSTVTYLHDVISQLPEGTAVAEQIVDEWLSAFKLRDRQESADNPFQRSFHPRIQAEFDAIKQTAEASTTLLDACRYISEHQGWGARQRVAMNRVTAEEIEATIKAIDVEDLKSLLSNLLHMCTQRGAYGHDFGKTLDNFILACRRIANDPGSGRLGRLIRLLFEDAKLELQLTDGPHSVT